MEILRRPPRGLMVFVLWIAICVLEIKNSLAQKIHVDKVKGEWIVSNDITLKQARDKAIEEAKIEALRKAGVPELISNYTAFFKSENGKRQSDLFESISSTDVFGEISDFEIVQEEKKVNDFGNIVISIWIDANVQIHKELKDPSLGCDVKGIKPVYLSTEKLTFNFSPWKDCYLKVFILSENEGSQLYPSRYERQQLFTAGNPISFPGKGFNYEVLTEKEEEMNHVIFLVTKIDVPFREKETPQNILKYISSISPNQKSIKNFSIIIKNE